MGRKRATSAQNHANYKKTWEELTETFNRSRTCVEGEEIARAAARAEANTACCVEERGLVASVLLQHSMLRGLFYVGGRVECSIRGPPRLAASTPVTVRQRLCAFLRTTPALFPHSLTGNFLEASWSAI